MDRVWLILQLQRATKANSLILHLTSLQKMCKLFFSYDHHNYARYTAPYLQTMLNLLTSHPGAEECLQRNGFSMNRSEIPTSRSAVDITIKQTINTHAKCQGGTVGFSRNKADYYRWFITRHAEAATCRQPWQWLTWTAKAAAHTTTSNLHRSHSVKSTHTHTRNWCLGKLHQSVLCRQQRCPLLNFFRNASI